VRSDKFQPSLFRLPIPKLEATLRRYLLSQTPLLAENEMERLRKMADAFAAGAGRRLDAELRAKDSRESHTSYISGPWTQMYLRDRRPIVFNHNPGIMLAADERLRDMTSRAANVLVSTLRFFRSLREGILRPEVYFLKAGQAERELYWKRMRLVPSLVATPFSYLFNAFPLDMSQYGNLFQSTRIPRPGADEVARFPDSKHVVVLFEGRIFAFDALDEHFNLFPPSHYARALEQIVASGAEEDAAGRPFVPLGLMTSEDREAWAVAREHLLTLPGNAEALHVVDSALYVISLDSHWSHAEAEDRQAVASVENVIYGGAHPANRWFDKSFSLIFSSCGEVAINFEHAWGDGVAVMRLIDDFMNDCARNEPFVGGPYDGDVSASPSVRQVHFRADEALERALSVAEERFHATRSQLFFDGYIMEGLGRPDCRKAKVG